MPYYDKTKKQWRGEVRLVLPSGRYRKSEMFPTKKAAREWEVNHAKEKRKEATEKPEKQTGTTFSALYSEYLSFCEHKYGLKTYHEKNLVGARFIAYAGINEQTSLDAITAETIQGYLIHAKEEATANRSNKDRKNLLAFWNWAQRIHDVRTNPVAKTYKLPHRAKEQYVPMESHVKQLLMVASKRERVFLQCYLQTAARKSEVFKWKWGDDVDFQSRKVRLSTQKTRDGSVEYVWLPMSRRLYEDLQWWYKNRQHRESVYVWTIPEGPYEGQPYTFRHKFLRGLCKRAGVPYFAFHSLRRYAASLLAMRGIPMKTIQRILRHKSLATTERYVKRLDEDLRSAVERLGE